MTAIRKLAAILAADVVRFSRLMSQDEAWAALNVTLPPVLLAAADKVIQ